MPSILMRMIKFRFAFIEYSKAEEADLAVKQTNDVKLDAKHTLKVNHFEDVDKLQTLGDKYTPPETQEYQPAVRTVLWIIPSWKFLQCISKALKSSQLIIGHFYIGKSSRVVAESWWCWSVCDSLHERNWNLLEFIHWQQAQVRIQAHSTYCQLIYMSLYLPIRAGFRIGPSRTSVGHNKALIWRHYIVLV